MVVSDPTSDHGIMQTKGSGIRLQGSDNGMASHSLTICADGCEIGVRGP